jgi:FkbM family methyltransferase
MADRMLGLKDEWNLFLILAMRIGVRAAVGYRLGVLGRRRSPEYRIHPRQAAHPVRLRAGSSDIEVFRQIFVEREYGCLDDLPEVRLVIDAGANVGYSSAYLLSQHPGCQVVAIEPDAGNFAQLQRNLAPYGERAKLVNAGLWSHTARLAMSRDKYRDGLEWTRQVRECAPGEPAEFEGVDVGTILAASGHDRISLLKVDIEGAEAVVFGKECQAWLGKVDAIAVELHDDSSFGNSSGIFFHAIRGHGFEVSSVGELTICMRPEHPPAAP